MDDWFYPTENQWHDGSLGINMDQKWVCWEGFAAKLRCLVLYRIYILTGMGFHTQQVTINILADVSVVNAGQNDI